MRTSALALTLGLGAALATPAVAQVDRYAVVRNGEAVGRLSAQRSGNRIDIAFRVDDNGRGPQSAEQIDLGPDGLPRHWHIRGRGETGAPVEEAFDWTGTKATWRSLNERGSAEAGAARAYVPAEASPYYLDVLLHAAATAPGYTFATWPEGSIRAERLREVVVGAARHRATVWALWGLDIGPVFVLGDEHAHLLAWLNSHHLTIPEAWIDSAAELQGLSTALDVELLKALTPRLLHRFATPVYVANVRIYDPVGARYSAATTITTFGGRITAIGPDAPPAEAVVIDGAGGVVLPGLCDVHVHLAPWAGAMHLAAGVTTTRDMGNNNVELPRLVAEFDAGRILGPRVLLSGYMDARSPYSAHDGFVVESLAEGLDKVRWYADHGYWQLKIASSMHPDWVAPLAAEAHRRGLHVAGHVPSFMSAERAVGDGFDEITHINQLLLTFMIDPQKDDTRTPFRFTALGERSGSLDLGAAPFRRMLSLMQAHHTAHDPTLAGFYGMLLSRPGLVTPADAPWIDHVPGPVQRSRRTQILDMKPSQDAAYRASAQKLLDAVGLLHAEGIALVPGTDDIPGLMLHSELETWQRAGIAPADVLRAATSGCAAHLGLDHDSGTVERGKQADLLLVPGDPLHDVSALRTVSMVMKAGDVFFPDEIYTAMQIRPFSVRPTLRLPR